MLYGIYNIIAVNSALKRFNDLSLYDIRVYCELCCSGFPVRYTGLYEALKSKGNTLSQVSLSKVLKDGIDKRYIVRAKNSGNVVYSLTIDGKRFLYDFAAELDRLVSEQVRKYGNGMHVE